MPIKSQSIKIVSRFILFVVFCILPLFFVFRYLYDRGLQYPQMISDFTDIGYYEIDPDTILEDISHGKSDVFKAIDDDSYESNNQNSINFFSWTQSDYLLVANALHQFVWGENLDSWKLYGMHFRRSCQNDPVGFGFADITYFKYNNQTGGYRVHEMYIYPNGRGGSWGGAEDWSRPLLGWESINSYLFKVTADNALQIAEENGGIEFRTHYNNECNIMLVLKPNPSNRDDWLVYYDYQGSSRTFEILINPYTGWH